MFKKILAKIFLSKDARELGELLKSQNRVIELRTNDLGGWILEEVTNNNENKNS